VALVGGYSQCIPPRSRQLVGYRDRDCRARRRPRRRSIKARPMVSAITSPGCWWWIRHVSYRAWCSPALPDGLRTGARIPDQVVSRRAKSRRADRERSGRRLREAVSRCGSSAAIRRVRVHDVGPAGTSRMEPSYRNSGSGGQVGLTRGASPCRDTIRWGGSNRSGRAEVPLSRACVRLSTGSPGP